MKKALLILVAAATVSSGAYAQEFMNINPDARITAMGNAGIAATGGAYPTFNNPASPLFEYHSVQASFAYTLVRRRRVQQTSVDGGRRIRQTA